MGTTNGELWVSRFVKALFLKPLFK